MRTRDEDALLAAYHEAGHAALAVGQNWVELAGAVELVNYGHGVAPVRLSPAFRAALLSDPEFDTDEPCKELILTFLAGAAAERRFALLANIPLTPEETRRAARFDYDEAKNQLAKINWCNASELDDASLAAFEEEVAEAMEHEIVWCVVERLATALLSRRNIPAEEATALVKTFKDQCVEREPPGGRAPS